MSTIIRGIIILKEKNLQNTVGKRFRQAVIDHNPLPIVGTINAYTALLAEHAGHHAIYCSGAGVANASYGLPDLGVTTREDVLTDVHRLTRATDLPVLVDIDTGWEDEPGGIAQTISSMIAVNAAAVHLEDQVTSKRCGHRPDKQLVSTEVMQQRIEQACFGRIDPDFVIMARTDSLANEGLSSAIKRSLAYVEAGADMIFFEAAASLEELQAITSQVPVPILANSTEFGKTPLFSQQQFKDVGVAMVLYPLSAFRAMSRVADDVYKTILEAGSQQSCLDQMQTREQLYDHLDYYTFEQQQGSKKT